MLTEVIKNVGELQDSNLFSKIQDGEKTVKRTVTSETTEIEKIVPKWKSVQNSDRENNGIFSISEIHEAERLYNLLLDQKHHIIDKIQNMNSILSSNKTQTDDLYSNLKNIKQQNNGQEFKDEIEFNKFVKENNIEIKKFGSTKELMNISNAFIKIDRQPKDFNAFIDKFPTVEPNTEQKNCIRKLIEKIIDKLFSTSQAEKIGKSIMKDLNKAIKQSESQKKDQGQQIKR